MAGRVRRKSDYSSRRAGSSTHAVQAAGTRRRTQQFSRGFKTGYEQGVRSGQEDFGRPFEGTSIIIPTYNGRDLLMKCIDSIEANTALPYEIIVVDNASSDGTVEAIRRRGGSIRLGVHPANLGFARAVNTGLMMSKGQNVVLLNNDTLVTERWLSNMLILLESEQDIGAVGPVTNYIGGSQQIEVPYQDIADMWSFAAAHNRSDPSRWQTTDRIAGFCVLMRREVWERTGYFDEGFKIGNFEDDDFMVRLRYLGRRIVIAGDTFIHHTGSATMRTLGHEGYQAVNERNREFFATKWGNSFERLQDLGSRGRLVSPLRSADYYPSHMLVRDFGRRLYWLEKGIKHSVVDEASLSPNQLQSPPVQLSMVDLRQLASGSPVTPAELELRQAICDKGSGEENEGNLYLLEDGRMCQVQQGELREFITAYAAESWGMSGKFSTCVPAKVLALPEGLPILPRAQLESEY